MKTSNNCEFIYPAVITKSVLSYFASFFKGQMTFVNIYTKID